MTTIGCTIFLPRPILLLRLCYEGKQEIIIAPLRLDLCCKIILPISNLSHQSNVSWAVMHGSQGRSLAIGSCQNWTRNIMNQANGKDKEATDTVPRVWDLSGEN